jgi:hypothetical protein
MQKLSKTIVLFSIVSVFLIFIAGCSENKESPGQISVRFTDSSLNSAAKSLLAVDTDFSSVMVSVVRIEIVGEDDFFAVVKDFGVIPLQIDLLDLGIDGIIVINEVDIGEGNFSQIRIIVEAPEENQGPPTNPNTYVIIGDSETKHLLFVPSGAQSGLKVHLTPILELGSGQSFKITIDFNSMQSIHKTGSNDRYIIRPTSMTASVEEAS